MRSLALNTRVLSRSIGALALLSSLTSAAHAEFTKADLESMVGELMKYAVKNPDYLYPIKCEIVDDKEVNAYATVEEAPNKKWQSMMIVNTGLVSYMKEDKKLIRAVICHEISHLSLGHCVGPVWKSKDFGNFWTRQKEMAADMTGAALLVRAGYDKIDFVNMLTSLSKLNENSWMFHLNSDHSSDFQRISKVSDDPAIYESLVQYQLGMALWDARNFKRASEVFDRVYAKQPKLFTAVINAACTSLNNYYDRLPVKVQSDWYRPDFGPLLAANTISPSKGIDILPEDRVRFKEALAKIEAAKKDSSAASQPKLLEMVALSGLLNPDDDKAQIQAGIDYYKGVLDKVDKTDTTRVLRFSNNIAVGLQRLGKTAEAADVMQKAIGDTGKTNITISENFGRAASTKDAGLAVNVMEFWLKNASADSPNFTVVNSKYNDLCKAANVQPQTFNGTVNVFEPVSSMFIDGKEVGLYDTYTDLAMIAGKPDSASYYDEKYKGLLEVIWKKGDVQAFVEDDNLLRITSRLPGSYIELQPADRTVTTKPRITVGMSRFEFLMAFTDEQGEQVMLSNAGVPEEWTYFGQYYLGVQFKDDKISAITFTPVKRG